MRRVLMVTPHFPPDSSAAAHRVRLLAPHLPGAGWTPTIVTVDPSAYEGRLDRDLEALVPSGLQIVRAPVWRSGMTRWVGLGDLGLRAFTGLRHACRQLLARERFDALFITIYPVYPALLGPALKAEFGVPFVLDYQDPWVNATPRKQRTEFQSSFKYRINQRLARLLEPRVIAKSAGIVSVSPQYCAEVAERYPRANARCVVLPFAPSGEDFAAAAELLLSKYPQYRAMGLSREQGTMIRITPQRVLRWQYAS